MPRSSRGSGRKIDKKSRSSTGGRSAAGGQPVETASVCTHGIACHFRLSCSKTHSPADLALFHEEASLRYRLKEIDLQIALAKVQHAKQATQRKVVSTNSGAPPVVSSPQGAPAKEGNESTPPGTREHEKRRTEPPVAAPAVVSDVKVTCAHRASSVPQGKACRMCKLEAISDDVLRKSYYLKEPFTRSQLCSRLKMMNPVEEVEFEHWLDDRLNI